MEKGGKAQRRTPPPPPQQPSASPLACVVLASCLRHACKGVEDDMGAPPPPTPPPPPRVGDVGRGGRKAPPPPEDKAAWWGGSGERVRDGPQDPARRGHAPCKPQRGDHRGCERRVERATTGATRHAPPPLCRGTGAVPRACAVLASCLRHASNEGKTTSPPPPRTPPPPQGWGMKEGRGGQPPPPPPEDKAARWGGSGERMRDGPHGCARRKHAPCKPQQGGHRGCERRVGRATTGATRQAPPPAEGQVPRLVPAPCLRRAYARGRTARAPPPPRPLLPHPPRKGAGTARRWRGDMGGGQRTDRRAWGRDGRRAVETQKKKQRTKQTNAQGEESEKTGTKTATNGVRPGRRGPARDAGEVPDPGGMGAPKGKTPPPHSSLALCLRRACVVPATCVLQREDDKGDKGDDGSGTRTLPRGQRGRVGRQRREGAGRTRRPCPKGARAVQAPTGGPLGVPTQER